MGLCRGTDLHDLHHLCNSRQNNSLIEDRSSGSLQLPRDINTPEEPSMACHKLSLGLVLD